jgi:hypothetical protein
MEIKMINTVDLKEPTLKIFMVRKEGSNILVLSQSVQVDFYKIFMKIVGE